MTDCLFLLLPLLGVLPACMQRVPSVPNSALSPYRTGDPALVRWVSIPVYLDSNQQRERPDGVLLKGDLVNGKTVAMERWVRRGTYTHRQAVREEAGERGLMTAACLPACLVSGW